MCGHNFARFMLPLYLLIIYFTSCFLLKSFSAHLFAFCTNPCSFSARKYISKLTKLGEYDSLLFHLLCFPQPRRSSFLNYSWNSTQYLIKSTGFLFVVLTKNSLCWKCDVKADLFILRRIWQLIQTFLLFPTLLSNLLFARNYAGSFYHQSWSSAVFTVTYIQETKCGKCT